MIRNDDANYFYITMQMRQVGLYWGIFNLTLEYESFLNTLFVETCHTLTINCRKGKPSHFKK